jgi:hypothetical protein
LFFISSETPFYAFELFYSSSPETNYQTCELFNEVLGLLGGEDS